MSLLSAQEIFKKSFVNKTGKITVSTASMQDYLNAVYDPDKDALRVVISGYNGDPTTPGTGSGSAGYWGEPVISPDLLPLNATVGTVTPVISNTVMSFYRKTDEGWISLSTTSSLYQSFIEWGIQNKSDLSFLVDKRTELEELLGDTFSIKEDIVRFDLSNANLETVDGEQFYVMSVDGYVLSIETYADSDSPDADKYITKTVFNQNEGIYGVTYIYFTKEEYEYFASLANSKNVAEIYYIQSKANSNINSSNNSIKEEIVELSSASPVKITVQDSVQNIEDVEDTDNDPATHYCIKINGYVLSIETYADNNATLPDKIIVKTIFDAETGVSSLYFTKEEYDYYSSLNAPKNVAEIYYIMANNVDSSKPNVKKISDVISNIVAVSDGFSYRIKPNNNTVYTLNTPLLGEDEYIEFKLIIQNENPYNISFSNEIMWNELADLNQQKTYWLIFRCTQDKIYGKIDGIF